MGKQEVILLLKGYAAERISKIKDRLLPCKLNTEEGHCRASCPEECFWPVDFELCQELR